jgi:23S rRNA-/tRNA-specific pseudouridylate synthase
MSISSLSALYLYQDEHIFALNKPAGIHSVGLRSGGGHSLSDLLLAENPKLAVASPQELDAGLVQRLDFDTSGIILGAKTREMWDRLHNAIVEGRFVKRYIALVDGKFTQSKTITSYIGSPYRGAKKMRSYREQPTRKIRALLGTSNVKLYKNVFEYNMSFVEVAASPARRHQVRVHTAELGYPLTGDSLYGSEATLPEAFQKTPRVFFLHAHTVKGLHPQTKQQLNLTAPFDF